MLPIAGSWDRVLDQVFAGFLSLKDVSPDWLIESGTGRRLGVDRLYPELGIALWFADPAGAQPGNPGRAATLTTLCRRAGITLIVIDASDGIDSRTLGETRMALSAAARRTAQQRGAAEVKRDLLPRIGSAKVVCQQIMDELAARSASDGAGREAAPALWQRPREWRLAFGREQVAALAGLVAFLSAILKRIALFVAVLLAVNVAAFLVVMYLDLRGPMAYNYVADYPVSISEMVEPYPEYLRNAIQGDLGISRMRRYSYGPIPVRDLLARTLPRSLVLLGAAVLLSIGLGITTGFLSVNYKTYRTNSLALLLSLMGFSMPGFYMAILALYLIIVLAMNYGRRVFFLPTSGFGLDLHLVLPLLALAARPTAEISRLTAELLGEELPKDYIRVARSKGLSERAIVMGHAFRNVVAAVINALRNSWAYLIGSLVIIEKVFGWGGVGQALIDAVSFSQFAGSSFNAPLVASLATATALLFLLADLVTGMAARALDPRLGRASGGAA
jgi:peptide/nickel transport system permease protein